MFVVCSAGFLPTLDRFWDLKPRTRIKGGRGLVSGRPLRGPLAWDSPGQSRGSASSGENESCSDSKLPCDGWLASSEWSFGTFVA
jgi:hypothetical protein